MAIAASNSTHHNATKLLHNSVVGNATAVVRLDSLEGLKSDAWFLYYALGAVFFCLCVAYCQRRQGRIQSAIVRGACLPMKQDPLGPIFKNSPLSKTI